MQFNTLNLEQQFDTAKYGEAQTAATLESTQLGNQAKALEIEAAKQKTALEAAALQDRMNRMSPQPVAPATATPGAGAQPQQRPAGPPPLQQSMAQGILPGESGGMPTTAPQTIQAPDGTQVPAPSFGTPSPVAPGQTPAQASIKAAGQEGQALNGYTPEQQDAAAKTPYQEFQLAGQGYKEAGNDMAMADKQIADGQKLMASPYAANYTEGEAMYKAGLENKEKAFKVQQEHSKLVKENLTQIGGLLGSVDSQGSLDNARMTAAFLGYPLPEAMPGPDGKPISTRIFTPALEQTFKGKAKSYMTYKEQLEDQDKKVQQKLNQEKENREAKTQKEEIKLKQSKDAREQQLQPIEMRLKSAQASEAEAKALQLKDTPAGGSKAAIVRARAENIAGSVTELGRSLSIISNMDIGTDLGTWGGVKPGTTLFTAPLSTAARGLTGESAKQYKIASSNIGIALATIDNGGYRPTAGMISNFQDKLAWQPTDTIYTKIFSMADAKEQAKARARITLEGPDLPEAQKAIVRDEIAKMDQLIPFGPEDVTNMQKKGLSINDWMANKQKIEALPPADKSAVEYAEAHPKDPNSKKILELHGVK